MKPHNLPQICVMRKGYSHGKPYYVVVTTVFLILPKKNLYYYQVMWQNRFKLMALSLYIKLVVFQLFKDTPISKALIPNFGNGPKNPPTTFSIDKEDLPKLFYHAALPEVSPLGCYIFSCHLSQQTVLKVL